MLDPVYILVPLPQHPHTSTADSVYRHSKIRLDEDERNGHRSWRQTATLENSKFNLESRFASCSIGCHTSDFVKTAHNDDDAEDFAIPSQIVMQRHINGTIQTSRNRRQTRQSGFEATME